MEKDIFQAIYEKYYKSLYLYALSLCGNRADADDLVQNTFLKAFLSYREGGSIRYWLTKVLQNEYFNLYKKRKRLVPEGDYSVEELAESAAKAAESRNEMLEQLIKEEQKRFLFAAIMELDTAYKQVMLGSIYFDLSDEEIAKQMGITRENVRKIRSRARKKLTERMEEQYGREQE